MSIECCSSCHDRVDTDAAEAFYRAELDDRPVCNACWERHGPAMIADHQRASEARTVHVVAWQSAGGAGFDWYADQDAAARAFADEEKNVAEFAGDEWTAFMFEVDVPGGMQDVVAFIDDQLDELCATAKTKSGPMTFPYNPDLRNAA
jgi:hypothetical protein